MKKSIKKRIIPLVILGVLVIAAYFFLNGRTEEIKKILEVSVGFIIILALLNLITFLLNGLRILFLVKSYGIDLKPIEWWSLSLINTFGNYITPFKGGTPLRAIYLKKFYKLPYTSFITTIGATYVISFFIYGVIGTIYSLFFYSQYESFALPILIFFLSILLVTSSIMFIPITIKERKNKILNRIIRIINEWKFMRKNKRLIVNLLTVESLLVAAITLRMFFAFKALSYGISFLSAIFISLFFLSSTLISITPAGLGIREAIVGFSSKAVNTGLGAGIIGASLDRAITIVLIFTLGPLFSYILSKYQIKRTTSS